MAKDESSKGVAVMGALRVNRFDCADPGKNTAKGKSVEKNKAK